VALYTPELYMILRFFDLGRVREFLRKEKRSPSPSPDHLMSYIHAIAIAQCSVHLSIN